MKRWFKPLHTSSKVIFILGIVAVGIGIAGVPCGSIIMYGTGFIGASLIGCVIATSDVNKEEK